MKAIIPAYIIDTREQEPYKFNHQSVRKCLKTGDYSIEGIQDSVVVEKKLHNEIVQCMTHGRERFEKELARSNDLRRLHIVVEASLVGVMDGRYDDYPNQTHPNAIRGTLAAWSNRFPNVQFWFANDREHGQTMTEVLLRRAWLDMNEQKAKDEKSNVDQ